MLPSDGTTDSKCCQAMVPPLSSDGTARARSPSFVKRSYRPDWVVVPPNNSLQVVVPPNNSDGTVNTTKSEDVTLFGSNSKAIGAYKYLTIFCMKEHESVNKILSSWGIKSVVKVQESSSSLSNC